MAEAMYWADEYVEKKHDAESAIRLIRSGQRVFIGSACGEPQELVRSLAENINFFTGLEIVRMMSQESAPLTEIANKTAESDFSIRHIYLGSASSKHF
jgi:acyl-CoA hydrolase